MDVQVTKLLDTLNHPLRKQIDELRSLIHGIRDDVNENIKWNGPNFSINGEDRVTIQVNPPKAFHLILHRGARPQKEPEQKILRDDQGILTWKSNDRAIVSFKDQASFDAEKSKLPKIISDWIESTT